MYQLILIVHVFAAVCLVGLVLIQQGKGAAVGAAFGSGASQTVFGSRGSGSFLLKVTIGFVVIFFTSSIALNYISSHAAKQSVKIDLPTTTQDLPTIPVEPVSPSNIPVNPTTEQPAGNVKL